MIIGKTENHLASNPMSKTTPLHSIYRQTLEASRYERHALKNVPIETPLLSLVSTEKRIVQ